MARQLFRASGSKFRAVVYFVSMIVHVLYADQFYGGRRKKTIFFSLSKVMECLKSSQHSALDEDEIQKIQVKFKTFSTAGTNVLSRKIHFYWHVIKWTPSEVTKRTNQ